MNIKWRITKKNVDQGSIEVLWWDVETGIEVGPYNIFILDGNGCCPQGDSLKRMIDGYTPLGEFDQKAKIMALAATSMDHIDTLLDVEHTADLNVFTTQAERVQLGENIAELATVQEG